MAEGRRGHVAVVAVDLDHRDRRKVGAEHLPVRPPAGPVEGVDADVGADDQQVVDQDDVVDRGVGQGAGDVGERRAAVGGDEHVGGVAATTEPGVGHPGGVVVGRVGGDRRDPGVRQARGLDQRGVLPVAGIDRPQPTLVGADPHPTALVARRDRRDDATQLVAGVGVELVGVAGQVAGEACPGDAVVGRPVQELRAGEQGVVGHVGGGVLDVGQPAPPVRGGAREAEDAEVAGAGDVALASAVLGARPRHGRVAGLEDRLQPVAAHAVGQPVALQRGVGDLAAVVLEAGHDGVADADVADVDGVVLGPALVRGGQPRLAVVGGVVHAAVVAEVDQPLLPRLEDHRVLVGVGIDAVAPGRQPEQAGVDVAEGRAAVLGVGQVQAHDEHAVGVGRVDVDPPEPPAVDRVGRGQRGVGPRRPRVATVVGDEEPAVAAVGGVGHLGVDPVGVGGGERHGHAAVLGRVVGGDVGDQRPGLAAVQGAVHSRPHAGVVPRVGCAVVIPHRDHHVVRVGRVNGDVDGAGGVVGALEPQLGFVHRGVPAVQATLAPGHEQVAGRGDEEAVAVLHDPADGAGVLQADQGPGLPVVGGQVGAGAAVDDRAAAGVGLTRAGQQHVPVAGHRADRLGDVVGPGTFPQKATLGPAPDAARGGRRVDDRRVVGVGHDVVDAPTDVGRSEVGPLPVDGVRPERRRLVQRAGVVDRLAVDRPLGVEPLARGLQRRKGQPRVDRRRRGVRGEARQRGSHDDGDLQDDEDADGEPAGRLVDPGGVDPGRVEPGRVGERSHRCMVRPRWPGFLHGYPPSRCPIVPFPLRRTAIRVGRWSSSVLAQPA